MRFATTFKRCRMTNHEEIIALTIRTVYDPPPVPFRDHDWCAFREGREEYGPFGWGTTEEEALRDLSEAYDEIREEESPPQEPAYDPYHEHGVRRSDFC
jgi:hypothetical protein